MRDTGYAGAAERQARWLLWQSTGVEAVGEERIHSQVQPVQAELPISRSRYNSVVQRMKQAGQRTGAYSPWA